MTSVSEQQTARVNVDDDAWRRFRILAIESNRSIADYLGQLVGDELRRSRKRKRRREEGAGATSEVAHQEAEARGGSKDSIRLADAKLLTALPRPSEPSRRQPP